MQDLTIKQMQVKSGVPIVTIRWKCRMGLVPGAYLICERLWLIPDTLQAMNAIKEKVKTGRKRK